MTRPVLHAFDDLSINYLILIILSCFHIEEVGVHCRNNSLMFVRDSFRNSTGRFSSFQTVECPGTFNAQLHLLQVNRNNVNVPRTLFANKMTMRYTLGDYSLSRRIPPRLESLRDCCARWCCSRKEDQQQMAKDHCQFLKSGGKFFVMPK